MKIDSSISPTPAMRAERSSVDAEILEIRFIVGRDVGLGFTSWPARPDHPRY
jgi:hypothetical protein